MNYKHRFKKLSLASALLIGLVAQPTNIVFAQDNESAPIQQLNFAVGGSATANDKETNYWGPDKTIDGIVNRDAAKPDQSRWSTNQSTSIDARILNIDLLTEKTFNEFVIEWERTNIQGFRIAVSNDNITYQDVYVKDDAQDISSITSKIKLDTPATGRYVRLTIDKYNGGSINWESVSLYEFMIIGDGQNLATQGNVVMSANGHEASSFSADKANDTFLQTRWASPANHDEHWLSMNLGSSKKIRSAAIEWERKNANDFTIQTSMDGTTWTDVKSFKVIPGTFRQLINFNKSVEAQYLRVKINGFIDQASDRSGKEVNWPTVSILELEAYENDVFESNKESLESVASNLKVPTEIDGTSDFILPSVPEGFDLSFIGADYEQIIDRDGTVYQPLVDTDVTVNFKVSQGEKSKETDAFTIRVKGKFQALETDNKKPVVIPEISEWKGASSTEGNFVISEQSRIMINPQYVNELYFMAEEFQKDYQDVTKKEISIVEGTTPANSDFYFTLGSSDAGLKEEGYIMSVDNALKVEAVDKVGAYWSTRTILQILKTNGNTIPKGTARDYPKYEVRGFMLDVARKPFSKAMVEDIIKQMSLYKMNDFQLHLNDNYIFLEDYASDEEAMSAYSAFRLESNVKNGVGLNKADLQASDLFYTKAEFKKMIDDNAKLGIHLIPEFDAPGHALPFTKVRPDLRLKNVISGQAKRRNEQLDLSPEHYEDSIGFIQSIWNEYLDNGIFDGTDVVNIGTDEYYGNKDNFRKFSDDLIKFIEAKGKTVRMWGSLSAMPGTVPVKSENVQLNIWNTSWARPTDMYKDGFDLINMADSDLYIVPNAGYYHDYLDAQKIYNTWQPNNMGGTIIPAGSTQMLGSAYAVWNDNVDKKADGISEIDVYDRFIKALPSMASKLWGDAQDLNYSDLTKKVNQLGDAPTTNPYAKESAKENQYLKYTFDDKNTKADSSSNGRDIKKEVNVAHKNNSLVLNGKESYIETPLQKLATQNTLSFDITLQQPAKPNDILFETDSEYGTHDIRVMADGTLGFTRELYDYSFNYTLPINKTVTLSITTTNDKTTLIVDGKPYAAVGKFVYNEQVKKDNISKSALQLPIERIGSKTNAIKAIIDNIVLGVGTPNNTVDKSAFSATADNQNGDGLIEYAFDNDPSTMWHSQWSPSNKPLPATIEIDMKEAKNINGFKYQTRSNGSNGNITKYTLSYLDENNAWQPLLENATFTDASGTKEAYFKPVTAQKLKLVVLAGYQGFGSAAELDFLEGKNDLTESTYNVDVYTEKTTDGSVSINKKLVKAGEKVTITAQPTKGYSFVGWYDELDQLISKDANHEATVTRNATYIAKFEKAIEVDKTDLVELIKTAEKIKGEHTYTPATLAALNSAIVKTQAVIDDASATEQEVKDAYKGLETAIKNLEKEVIVTKDALAAQIEIAKSVIANKDNYVASTIKGLEALLAEVEAVYNDEAATQADVDAATKAITTANMKARVKADKVALADIIAKVNAMDLSKYTEASVKALKEVVAKAQKVMDNEAASQIEVDASIKNVGTALQSLEVKTNGGSGSTSGNTTGGNNTTNGTSTGDSTNVILWLSLIGGCLLVLNLRTRNRHN